MVTGKRVFWFAVILAGVILAAVGCIPTRQWQGPSAQNAREWGDDVQPTVEAIDVERIGTLAALDVAERQAHLDATAQAAAAAATVEAIRAGAEVQRIAATRQSAAATSAAWDRAVQATSAAHDRAVQLTAVAYATQEARAVAATSEAAMIEATRQAAALEATRQRERWEMDATATAWAVGYQATADALYATRRAEATAEVVSATRQSHQATATRAAEKREETLGAARDYGLPAFGLVLVLAAIVGGVWLAREWMNRPQPIQRSLLGDALPMMFRGRDGRWLFLDIDRQPGPVIELLPNGGASAPQLRSPAQEERTTARDQALDGVSRPRLGGGHSAQPLPMAEPPQAQPEGLQGVRILRTLGQASTAGLLPPGQVEAIEAVWAEEPEED